jgi:hypothetical protein
VLYQNFDLGVGFITLYIIVMAQILFCNRTNRIASLAENGVHVGNAVVPGAWDDPVINQTIRIIDTSGTCDQVNDMVRDQMTSSISSTIDINNFFNFHTSSLSASAQSELNSVKRVYLEDDVFMQGVAWSLGLNEQVLKDDYEIT